MIKLNKFIFIYLVLLNSVFTLSCPFNKNGEGNTLICYFDQSGNIYQSTKNKFCQNFPNFSFQGENNVYTLHYCQYHQCLLEDCQKVAKNFKNQNLESGTVKLKINNSICYEDLLYHQQRKVIDSKYSSIFIEQNSSEVTSTKCCINECNKNYSQQGCSSSGLFYSLNDFCEEFCKNRDLFLLNCPAAGCSTSTCLKIDTSFPKFQHCQINLGVITLENYTSLHTYFNSLVSQTPITQQFILCYDNGQQIPCKNFQQCYQQQCLDELKSYTNVCDKSGYFQTLNQFCKQNASQTITSYSNEITLCDGIECANESLCCDKACVAFRNSLILPTCYQDSFCGNFCNTDYHKNEVVCKGLGCYVTDCCIKAFPDGYCKSDYVHEQCQGNTLTQLPQAKATNQQECDILKQQNQSTFNSQVYYCYQKNDQIYIEYDTQIYLQEKVQNNIQDIQKLNCKNPPCNIYDCKYFKCIQDNNTTDFNGKCDIQLQIYQQSEQFCNAVIYNFKEVQKCGNDECNLNQCYDLRYQNCLDKQTNFKTKCSLDFNLYTIENYCNDQSKNITNNYYQCKDLLGNELNCKDCLYFQCMQLQPTTTSLCVQTNTSYFSYYGTLKDFCLANDQQDYQTMFSTRIDCQKQIGCAHSLDCCYHQCLKTEILFDVCDEKYLVTTPEQACQKQCYQSINIKNKCEGNCTIQDCRQKKCLDELLEFPGNICYKVNPNQQFTFSNDSRRFFIDKQSFCDYIKIEETKDDYQIFVDNASYCENCDNEYCCCVENCLIEKPYISCVSMKNTTAYALTSITQTCELGCKHEGHKIKYCEVIENSVFKNCEQKECNYFQCNEQTQQHQGIICLFGESYQYQFFHNTKGFCDAYQGINIDYMEKIRNDNHKCNDDKSCSSEEDCCVDKCRNVDYYQACSSDFKLLTKFEYCEIKCIEENPIFYYCRGQGGQLTHCNDCSFQACQHFVEDTYRVKSVQSNEVCGHHFEKFQKIEDFCNFIQNQNTIQLIFCKDQFGNHRMCSQQECCQKYCLENQYNFQPHCDNKNFNFFHTIQEFCNVKCNQTSLQSYKVNDQYASEYTCCVQKCKLNKKETLSCILTIENSLVFDIYTTEGICHLQCSNVPYSIHNCKGDNCKQIDCDYQKCLFEIEKTNYNKFCGSHGILYNSSESFCTASLTETMLHMKHLSCNGKECNNSLDCCKAACIYNTRGNNICEVDTYKCYSDVEQLCIKQCGWVKDPNSMYQPVSLFIKEQDCTGCAEKICHLRKCIVESCSKNAYSYNFCMRNQNCTIFVLKTPAKLCDYFKNFEYQSCPSQILDKEFYDMQFNDLILQNRIKICKDKDTPRDCTLEDCQYWPCERLLQTDQGNDVCYEVNNEIFYESTREYCLKFNKQISHTFHRCNGKQCVSKETCCESICLKQNQNIEFIPICDANFNEIRTIEQYCRDKCHDQQFFPLTCGTKNCSLETCRIKKCQLTGANTVCNETFQLSPSYAQCLEDNYSKKYYTCFDDNYNQIDCTEKDCETFKCLKTNEAYLDGAICLSQEILNEIFFKDKYEYCSFLAQNNLSDQYSLFTKYIMQCINSKNEITQCKSSCCICSKCELDLLGFKGQILADNDVLFFSAKEFCRWKYVNKIPLEIKKCFGQNQTQVCLESTNETEIQQAMPSETYQKCLNSDKLIQYQGNQLCGEDGVLYSNKYDYCSSLLQNSIQNFQPLTCDFDCPVATSNMQKPLCIQNSNKVQCSQKECQVYKCMAELRKQNILFPLCLNSPYKDIVFYQTSKHFCMDKIQNSDENYVLNQSEINQECYKKNNCNAFLCYGLSFIKNYKIGRIGTKLITGLEYQNYLHQKRFQNNRDHPFFLNEVEFCYDQQGELIDCPSVCTRQVDCDKYCVNYLREQGYPFDTICIRNRFQEVKYYQNLEDFCSYVADEADYDFDVYRDYFLCGENGDEQCTNQNSCFLTNCIKHPEDIPSLVEFLDQGKSVIKNKCEEIYGKNMVQLFQIKLLFQFTFLYINYFRYKFLYQDYLHLLLHFFNLQIQKFMYKFSIYIILKNIYNIQKIKKMLQKILHQIQNHLYNVLLLYSNKQQSKRQKIQIKLIQFIDTLYNTSFTISKLILLYDQNNKDHQYHYQEQIKKDNQI